MRITVLAPLALAAFAGTASANIMYTTGNYGQDFNTLAFTGTPTWTNDSTIAGWHLYQRTSAGNPAPVPHVTYATGTGSSATGQFYSFGAASSPERALGGVGSDNATQFGGAPAGQVAGWIAVAFVNANAYMLTEFTIGFRGEQWRDGGVATAQTMVLQYGFGPTFASVANWTAPGGNFDWTSQVATTTGAPVNGNGVGAVPNRGGTVSNLTWNPGDTLWIRWIEMNDASGDHGLAIDDCGFSALPTPGAATLLGCGILASARRRRA